MATVINSDDCIVWTKWATPQRLKQFKENKIILFLTKIFRPFTSNGMRMAETYDNTPFCKSFTVVLRNRCRPTSLMLSLSLSLSLFPSESTIYSLLAQKSEIYTYPFLLFSNYYFSLSCGVTELYFNSLYNFILH